MGHSVYFPPLTWVDDNQAVMIPNLDDDGGTLTLWRLPLDGSEAASLGSVENVPVFFKMLSPDFNLLLMDSSGQTALTLTQIADGVAQTYTEGERVKPLGWGPDSRHFIFEVSGGPNALDADYETAEVMIGHICEAARSFENVPESMRADLFTESVVWLDDTRFILARRGLAQMIGISSVTLYLGNVDGALEIIMETVGEEPGTIPVYAIARP